MAPVRWQCAVLRPGRGRQVRRGGSGDRHRGELPGPAVFTHPRRRGPVVPRPVRAAVVDHGGGVGRGPRAPPDGPGVGHGRRPRVGGAGRGPARGAQSFPGTGPFPPVAADHRRPPPGRRGERRRPAIRRAAGGGPAGTDGRGGAGGTRRPPAAPRSVSAAAAGGTPRRGGLDGGTGQGEPVADRTTVTRLSPPGRGTGRAGDAVGPDPPTGPMYALVP